MRWLYIMQARNLKEFFLAVTEHFYSIARYDYGRTQPYKCPSNCYYVIQKKS